MANVKPPNKYVDLFFEIRKEFDIPWEKAQECLKECNGDYRAACEKMLKFDEERRNAKPAISDPIVDLHYRMAKESLPPPTRKRKINVSNGTSAGFAWLALSYIVYLYMWRKYDIDPADSLPFFLISAVVALLIMLAVSWFISLFTKK